MSYRVFWAPHSEQRFEELIRQSPIPSTLAVAAKQIDQLLTRDPTSFGESRYDTIRIGFVRPLAVQFEVMSDVLTVIVHDVWCIDRK